MEMKRKLAWKLLLLGVLCGLLAGGFSILVDPYNVFHWSCARDNGVEPNKNYVKTQFVLHNVDKYDTFIFGNSRVGSIDAAKIGDTCYNMYYADGLPAEHYENLKGFLEAGVPVRKVYLGVDDVACFTDPAVHDGQLIRQPYRTGEPRIQFLMRYLNPSVTLQSLETICAPHEAEPDFQQRLYSTGNYYLRGDLTDEELAREVWPYYDWHGESALEDIRRFRGLCDENGISLIVFVNPEYEMRFGQAIENGYLDFLRGLAQITDYYCFCGYNDVTMDKSYFQDISHYRQSVGDLMIRVMNGEEPDEELEKLLAQGFGTYVTTQNVEEVTGRLEKP